MIRFQLSGGLSWNFGCHDLWEALQNQICRRQPIGMREPVVIHNAPKAANRRIFRGRSGPHPVAPVFHILRGHGFISSVAIAHRAQPMSDLDRRILSRNAPFNEQFHARSRDRDECFLSNRIAGSMAHFLRGQERPDPAAVEIVERIGP
jgi:hypothetical protein